MLRFYLHVAHTAFRRQLIPSTSNEVDEDNAPPGSAGAAHPMLRATGTVSGSAGATRRDFLRFAGFGALDFRHFFLQPMDGPEREKNTELAMHYCRAHPRWRLSLQTHKILGIP